MPDGGSSMVMETANTTLDDTGAAESTQLLDNTLSLP